jgi:hypothetical protein
MEPRRRDSGASENAIKTQIWAAICVYVLVALAKKRLSSVPFSPMFWHLVATQVRGGLGHRQ